METKKLSSVFSVTQLFDRGLDLTDVIKRIEEQNLNLSEEIELMNRKIKEYQDHATEKIAKATDSESKKKYTNESQRLIARRNLLRDSQDYNQHIDNLNSMKNSVKVNDIEIRYRVHRLRLINSYLRYTPD